MVWSEVDMPPDRSGGALLGTGYVCLAQAKESPR